MTDTRRLSSGNAAKRRKPFLEREAKAFIEGTINLAGSGVQPMRVLRFSSTDV